MQISYTCHTLVITNNVPCTCEKIRKNKVIKIGGAKFFLIYLLSEYVINTNTVNTVLINKNYSFPNMLGTYNKVGIKCNFLEILLIIGTTNVSITE